MPDPQTQTTLSQVLTYALALLLGGGLGGGGKVVLDRRRRNGNGRASKDLDRVLETIQEEGRETRTVLRENTKAIGGLTTEIARMK